MADYAKEIYGARRYAEKSEDIDPSSKYVDLLKYLPLYWHSINEMAEIQESLGHEVGLLLWNVDDLDRQRHLETATWGLNLWEKDYGLSTDVNKSYEFRRERIRAKKRGNGTTTKQQIINAASAFAGGEATVIELPAENRFIVKFIGLKGIPGNMADLSATIDEIKPAHLTYEYEYTYNWWEALKDKTWENCSTLSWNQLRTV